MVILPVIYVKYFLMKINIAILRYRMEDMQRCFGKIQEAS